MAGDTVITVVGYVDRTNAGQDLRRSRGEENAGMQPDPTDGIEYCRASEAFRPDDVDVATHDEGRCNLSVDVCPACCAAEHDEGPDYDWMDNSEGDEADESEPGARA